MSNRVKQRHSEGCFEAHESPLAASEISPPFSFSTTRYSYAETDPSNGSRKHTSTADFGGVRYYGYRYYNPDLGRWVKRDPLGEQGELLLYGFVRNNSIGSFDILGLLGARRPQPSCSSGLCCDRCKKTDDPIVTGLNIHLMSYNSRMPAKSANTAIDIFNDTQMLALMQSAGGIGASCFAAAWKAAVLLSVADTGINMAMYAGWAGNMKKGVLNKIKANLIFDSGARIVVRLKWAKCEEERCWPFFWKKRLDWKDDYEDWYKCSAKSPLSNGVGLSRIDLGVGARMLNPAPAISKAIPGCIKEAMKANGL